VDSDVITVDTGGRPCVRDITAEAEAFVSGRGDGLLHVFAPHATAGIALIEIGAGGTGTAARGTDGTTCYRPSSRRTPSYRC
jgi:hypothetical protein